MPTTVTARSVVQESLRGIEGAADGIVQASRKRGRKIKRRTIPAPAANTSTVTSTGNDQGFDPVFATQAEPFARPAGVFIGISASGDSRKILPAVRIAGLRIEAIAWTGGTGGKLKTAVDVCPCTPSGEALRLQRAHLLARHAISEFVEHGLQRR